MENHRLTNIYFDFDDCMNECGIGVRFDRTPRGGQEGLPITDSTVRNAVAMRDHTPDVVVNALRYLADWIDWKFCHPHNHNRTGLSSNYDMQPVPDDEM